ncbi:hypothetical protein MSG28_000719 [Choristoneura fumiferana]|uniref:Uncharacterized protein n=1 Tax=Choristoneura fumiferana TaxID=7141 RepID=A0ACC0K1W7_CHOFU|nr:hypothetical protein MSG28_000719 [Choristoneura fumiferana]
MSRQYKDNCIQIRPAKIEDMEAVAVLIQELAEYEKMPEGPKLSVADLQRDGFESNPPVFRCLVAVEKNNNGTDDIVGYAIYFPTFSTWEGRSMMLEDLCVKQSHRRRGIGDKIFNAVAKEATDSKCSRLDFHVLEWNPARSFYNAKGAVNLTQLEQWCFYRLTGDALTKAAGQH